MNSRDKRIAIQKGEPEHCVVHGHPRQQQGEPVRPMREQELVERLPRIQAEARLEAYLKVRQALEGAGDAPIPEGVCGNEDQEEGFSDGVCCTLNFVWKCIAELEAQARSMRQCISRKTPAKTLGRNVLCVAPAKEGEKP